MGPLEKKQLLNQDCTEMSITPKDGLRTHDSDVKIPINVTTSVLLSN
jgi:hypothetical protein